MKFMLLICFLACAGAVRVSAVRVDENAEPQKQALGEKYNHQNHVKMGAAAEMEKTFTTKDEDPTPRPTPRPTPEPTPGEGSYLWCECRTGEHYIEIYPEDSPGQMVKLDVGSGTQSFGFDFGVRRVSYRCSGSTTWHFSSKLGGTAHMWKFQFEYSRTPWHHILCRDHAGKLYYSAFEDGNYKLSFASFPAKDVAKEMVYSDSQGATANSNNIPAEFAGLWWMDGNPAGTFETVASFGRAQWWPGLEGCRGGTLSTYTSAESEKGVVTTPQGHEEPCQGRLSFKFSGDSAWAMPDTYAARGYALAGIAINQNMEFICGGPSAANLTVCKLGSSQAHEQSFWNRVRRWFIAHPFNKMWQFSMVKVSQQSWIRYSFGDRHEYYLKQITDGEGKAVEPYFSWFNSKGKAKPEKVPDVYGNGGDTRAHVANVPDLFVIRW